MAILSKKKLVLIGPIYPYRGGIAHFSETMYWGLQARGHTVEAVTFTRQYPELLFPGKTQYESGTVENPVPSQRLLDSINPLSWYKTARHVAGQTPDVVIFQYWMPFFAPALGRIAKKAKKAGSKVLVVVHNAIPHERRPGDLSLSRSFLKMADGCVVMSEAVARDLETLGVEAPIKQVVHPIYDIFGASVPQETARAQLGLAPTSPILLFFGFIRPYKGLQVLLESMPRIVKALPEVRLLVAGEFYEDAAPYQALIDENGLRDHVLLHGDYIPNTDVPRYFGAADVVVQPYVTATQSGVAQIAFHFDKPAIITDVGGLAEVVPHEKAGLVVPPEDPEALAAAVVRFFKEQMADRLTKGVQQEKQKYSWDRLYEAIEALIA